MTTNFLKTTLGVIGAITIVILLFLLLTPDPRSDHFGSSEYLEDLQLLSEQITDLQSREDLDQIMVQTEDRAFALLGESSHGTSEYYKWRAEISKRLISENNFSFIAIEGDWPNIYTVNKYVKSLDGAPSTAQEALDSIERWPPWMWNNEEFLDLVTWVKEYNEGVSTNEKVGIYGMDMQDLGTALEKTKETLERLNPEFQDEIMEDLNCLEPYQGEIQLYAETYFSEGISCEENISNVFESFELTYSRTQIMESEELFKAFQNILAIKYAEAYGRKMTLQSSESWNKRVEYMNETVNNLYEKYESKKDSNEARGIVWAHNTHVGDARATDMANTQTVNIGQLLRKAYGENKVFILGFGTYQGQVMASYQWGNQGQVMDLPEAIPDSIEAFLEKVDSPSFIITLNQDNLPNIFTEKVGHRAKGVVYNPSQEENNYVPTVLGNRYDSFIFIKETSSLNPL